jgi:hypothetical protein
MRLGRLVFGLVGALAAIPSFAQTPAFDPREWKGKHAGPSTQVLTLGSAHLGQMEKPPTREMLAPLLDKLAAFKPDIITHEGISGEQCDVLERYKDRYPSMFDTYCWGTEDVRKSTGLTVPDAMAASEKMLAAWPKAPTAADRRKLASLFLAANNRPSAQVQWLQLPPEERKLGDGIDEVLLKIITRAGAKPNETYDIGVVLAARLGLNRVYAVDDHTADSIQGLAGAGFEPAIQKIWSAPDSPAMARYEAAEKKVAETGDMLRFYRMLNAPATQRLFITGDFGAALKQQTPELYGRQYVAWYETRNLRMVANIREAFGNKPGARVLNIVGASHKAYYDAYLDMMHEVKLVDALSVLK